MFRLDPDCTRSDHTSSSHNESTQVSQQRMQCSAVLSASASRSRRTSHGLLRTNMNSSLAQVARVLRRARAAATRRGTQKNVEQRRSRERHVRTTGGVAGRAARHSVAVVCRTRRPRVHMCMRMCRRRAGGGRQCAGGRHGAARHTRKRITDNKITHDKYAARMIT